MYGKLESCRTQVTEMEEKKTLTMDFVTGLMEPSYTLVWIDYRDNFDNSLDIVQECLDKKNSEGLCELICDWYNDGTLWETVLGILTKLKNECVAVHDFDREYVETFFEEHENDITYEIYNRNTPDILNELIKNTDDIPIRVEMMSNYDCINSNWLESQGGYRYEESYFGDMIDALNLNPARVKKTLVEKGYTVYGRFPDKKYRDGKEQVSYEQFYQELINSCCGANLLTYIGKVSLKDLYDTGFSPKEVIIPKGNYCGIFSSMYGGGSLLEMKLRKDVRLKLEVRDCHGFRFRLDNENSKDECSIKHVYGVCNSFFGKRIGLVAS